MEEKQKTVDAEKISEEFSRLEESKREISRESSEDCTSIRSEFRGMQKAKVREVKVKESRRSSCANILLKVEAEDGIHNFRLKNTREYDQSNPFARFLEYYDISTTEPSKLVGLEVKMMRKRKRWTVYIPDSLDKYSMLSHRIDMIARHFGFQSMHRMSVMDGLLILFFAGSFVSIFTVPLSATLVNVSSIGFLTAFLLTTLGGFATLSILYRLRLVAKERVKEWKQDDRIN